MNQEQILDALQFIDDDMIERVNVLRKHPDRHKHLWLNYLAVAACIMLAIFSGFKYFNGNVPTENNSSTNNGGTINTNKPQNEIDDMFGDTENKNESANQNTSDNNSSLRDEVAGSTGNTSNIGSSTNTSFTHRPIHMEITEISDNSFKGRVINKVTFGNAIHFEENQVITVVYRKDPYADFDTLFIKDLKVGEKVYVLYGSPDANTIYTSYIRYDDKF